MKVGYLRVSTEEQRPDRQIDALEPVCDELHIEKLSAIAKKRPVFDKVVGGLEPGDTLVVWDLDRAFRSTIDALLTAERLRERGVEFQIVTLNIDTSEPAGELFYTIVAAYAQFERRILSKRTKEGLAAARKRGQRLGRRPKLSSKQIKAAIRILATSDATIKEMAFFYGVHPWTLTRSIRRYEKQAKAGPSHSDS